jgi:hypothetical protein
MNSARFISVFLFVAGCGTANTSQVQLAACQKQSSAKGTEAATAGRLNFADVSQDEQQRLGLGYVDITTDTSQGVQTRRCTMSLAPISGKLDFVRVTTAGHCGWQADSEEFAKSKFQLQIYYKGGYFPIAAELQGQQDWHVYARTLSPYAAFFPEKIRKRFLTTTTDLNKNDCLTLTKDTRSRVPSEADILCSSKGEARTLVAKITVDERFRSALNVVLASAEAKRRAVLDNFMLHEQMVFKAVLENPSPYEMLPSYLEEFGFKLNSYFCKSPVAELPKEVNGDPETQGFCHLREVLIDAFKKQMPQWWEYLKPSAEKSFSSYAEMRAYHQDNLRCAFASLDDFNPTLEKPVRNACDRDMLSWYVWRKWVRQGLQNLSKLQVKNSKLHGFTPETFFSLHTNSFASREDAEANNSLKSRAKYFPIDPSNGVFTLDGAMAFVLNPVREGLWVTKKDSGSLFSIFGVIPAGVLSSYNGEPTSGGASILPLPASVETETYSSSDATVSACASR